MKPSEAIKKIAYKLFESKNGKPLGEGEGVPTEIVLAATLAFLDDFFDFTGQEVKTQDEQDKDIQAKKDQDQALGGL